MTPDQALELGRRIVNTCRPTPPLTEWQEVLAPKNHPMAVRAFEYLREHGNAGAGLDIPTYAAKYRELVNPASSRTGATGAPSEHCPHCRGCGFEDGPIETETVGGQPHVYTTVVPCRCTTRRTA